MAVEREHEHGEGVVGLVSRPADRSFQTLGGRRAVGEPRPRAAIRNGLVGRGAGLVPGTDSPSQYRTDPIGSIPKRPQRSLHRARRIVPAQHHIQAHRARAAERVCQGLADRRDALPGQPIEQTAALELRWRLAEQGGPGGAGVSDYPARPEDGNRLPAGLEQRTKVVRRQLFDAETRVTIDGHGRSCEIRRGSRRANHSASFTGASWRIFKGRLRRRRGPCHVPKSCCADLNESCHAARSDVGGDVAVPEAGAGTQKHDRTQGPVSWDRTEHFTLKRSTAPVTEPAALSTRSCVQLPAQSGEFALWRILRTCRASSAVCAARPSRSRRR